MKKITFLMLLFVGSLQAQEIKWLNINEALAAQAKNPKPIFMDVYTDWCGPCKMLDKNTFTDKAVIDYINKNFYAVKFNAEGDSEVRYQGKTYSNPQYDANRKGRNATHEFTLHLKVQGYPSMYILNQKGDVDKVIVGYYQPEQLLTELK
jgi:thioredoxin-related protein